MIVTCPRCLTKYNLPEGQLVSGAEFNLHCSRCGWEFLFSLQDLDGDQKSTHASSPPEVGEPESMPAEATDDPVGLADEGSTDAEVANEVEAEAESVGASPPVVEEVAVEVPENDPDESIFELADDFDSEEDFLLDELPDSQKEAPELIEKSKNEGDDQEVEDLVLDIDDLNLDEIEFDSFDDDLDTVGGLDEIQKESPKELPTQIDDDGDLDDLLDQVEGLSSETASTIVEGRAGEPAKPAEADSFVEGSVSSPVRVKSSEVTDKRRGFILVLSCFVVLSLALWIGYGLWQRFSVDMVKHLKLVEVENRRLRLSSERIVIVVRGKVINSSPKLVTDLKIKGVLLDEAGQVVAEVVTAGGVSFSEEELDRLDGSKLAMLENSTVTLSPNGGELPFMIAFYDYPERARECFVELSSFKVKKGPRP